LAELLDDLGQQEESEACFRAAATVTEAQMRGSDLAVAKPKSNKRGRTSAHGALSPPRKSSVHGVPSPPRKFCKREYLSYEQKHLEPYEHTLRVASRSSMRATRAAARERVTLTIAQRPYTTQGFASTVWDSAIVLARLLEREPALVRGQRVVELGAGCGLPGIVAASLGAASVALTDFATNLPLLEVNLRAAGVRARASTAPLEWGAAPPAGLRGSCDVVLGADLMYVPEAAALLVQTARELLAPGGVLLLSYGRNRSAEPDVRAAAACAGFLVSEVADARLDPDCLCEDVTVLSLAVCRGA
jgi:predicted nicotinamide N-methyase